MTTRMSPFLVLIAVLAFGCSDGSGPNARDAQSGEDPGNRRGAMSDQVRGDDSDNDEDGVGERSVAGNHPLGPRELRGRWNELVGATDDGSLGAQLLGMGELRPAGGNTVGAAIGDGGAAAVTASLSADGTLSTITISLIDDPNATQARRMLTQLALPRLLLASTLPSWPALSDPAVTEPAEALSLDESQDGSHGSSTVVAEGITYSARSDADGWTFVARIDP